MRSLICALVLSLGLSLSPARLAMAASSEVEGFLSQALLSACKSGKADAALELIEKGANPFFGNEDPDDAPLVEATKNGLVAVVKKSLEKVTREQVDSQPGIKKDLTLAYLWACRKGNVEILELLSGYGIEPTFEYGDEKLSPLSVAVQANKPSVLQFLVKKGLDLKTSLNAPKVLLKSSQFGHLESVKFLVESGIDPNSEVESETPLSTAAIEGKMEVVEYLVAQGADLNRAYVLNKLVSELASGRGLQGQKRALFFLLAKGANVNISWKGLNLFEQAIISHNLGPFLNPGRVHSQYDTGKSGDTNLTKEIISQLLQRGAKVEGIFDGILGYRFDFNEMNDLVLSNTSNLTDWFTAKSVKYTASFLGTLPLLDLALEGGYTKWSENDKYAQRYLEATKMRYPNGVPKKGPASVEGIVYASIGMTILGTGYEAVSTLWRIPYLPKYLYNISKFNSMAKVIKLIAYSTDEEGLTLPHWYRARVPKGEHFTKEALASNFQEFENKVRKKLPAGSSNRLSSEDIKNAIKQVAVELKQVDRILMKSDFNERVLEKLK